MSIDTGNHPPIALRPYRVPLTRCKFIEDEIDDMLRAGLIVQSRSPWSAPVVFVSKKDLSLPMCVDYRRLNDCTAQYNYPLPHIDDILAMLEGSIKCFSSMDMMSGYHQIVVKEGGT